MTAHYALFSNVYQQIVREALAQNGRLPNDATNRLAMAIKGELPRRN